MRETSGESSRGPAVLIVGGLLASPWLYFGLRRRTLRRGAARAAIAPVFGIDWVAALFAGPGRLTSRVARAIDRLSEADGGRPILVIAHSAGGILSRLAVAQAPFDGARLARPGAVGAVVTLGTPHAARRVDGTLGYHGRRALRFLAQHGSPPGRPPVLALRSAFPEGDGAGPPALRRLRGQLARLCYVAVLGREGHRASGDGMVPLACAPLPGADGLELDGFAHGPLMWGTQWYGSDAALDEWWDRAVALWRGSIAQPG